MAAEGRRGPGLAGRIVRVTLLVGAVTVLTAGAVAIFGAYRLAADQSSMRDHAALQMVQDEVVGRFSAIETFAAKVSEQVYTQRNTKVLDASLSPLVGGSAGVVDRVVVADRAGNVITAFPPSFEASSPIADAAFLDAITGGTGFRRVPRADGGWDLWLMRTAFTPSGKPVVVLVSADSAFLAQTLTAASGGTGRVVTVLESGRPLLSSYSSDPPNLLTANWAPDSTSAGRVTATSNDARRMVGYYTDVRGIEGVDWRLVITEPDTVVASSTLQAVAPTMLVLLLGGIFGVGAALVVSRRLVRPLKALESMAYRAANGSFVQPVSLEDSDEIGRVGNAFNAVALRLNALHDLSQLLASASQLDQVLDGILSAMRHIVGPGIAAIYLLDEDGEWIVPARARGLDAASIKRVRANGSGWLPEALQRNDVAVHTADVATLEENLPGLGHGQTVALTAPLVSGHAALGVIVVLRRADEPVSEAEREMVHTFSAQAAVAVQNSRLFEAETESLRVAEALRTVAERLVRPGALADALIDVEDIVTDLFEADGSHFGIADRPALGLPAAEDRELEHELLTSTMRLFATNGARAQVVRPGDEPNADAAIERLGAKALLIAPIAIDSEHGAVLVVSLNRTSAPRHDLELAEAVADEVELALDNAFLYERAVARASNLETVFRISQAVGSSLQVNVVLNRVLDVVQKILSADAVALMTYDTRKRSISTAMARGLIPPELVTIELEPGEDVPGYVFSTGEPAAFRDLEASTGGIAGRAAAHGMRSLLAVPLLARGRSIGVLMVFSAEGGAFSDEDMSVLQTFASQAALALDTARLYSHEHEVASILQQSILPDALPDFPEIEAASVYQPAGGEAEIGGDYYDLFRGPDAALWFAIADVCGKGVVAATKTSMIKYSVRALVAAGLGPSAVLGEVNRMVAETGDPSDIVTLWVGRLVPGSGALTYASGGHPPAIVRHGSGAAERTGSTGPLLGALADVVYGEETLQLATGDMVLLYTDGVTESRCGKEFFGEDRVQEALLAGGGADEVVRRLLTLVRRWVHGELRDDVAVLAIALRPVEREHGSAREGKAD